MAVVVHKKRRTVGSGRPTRHDQRLHQVVPLVPIGTRKSSQGKPPAQRGVGGQVEHGLIAEPYQDRINFARPAARTRQAWMRPRRGMVSGKELFHEFVEIFVDNSGTTSVLQALMRVAARVPAFEAVAS